LRVLFAYPIIVLSVARPSGIYGKESKKGGNSISGFFGWESVTVGKYLPPSIDAFEGKIECEADFQSVILRIFFRRSGGERHALGIDV
jgi:hypothetical protein